MSDISTLLAKFQAPNSTDIVSKLTQTYLPYMNVANGLSDAVANGICSPGEYVITAGGGAKKLGREVDAILCLVQMKALRTGDNVESSTDPESAVFKKIAADSMGPNSGCMWGPEFLVYLPSEGSFTTFFLGSKSGRRQTASFSALLGKSVKLTAKQAENAKGKWFVPQVAESATPHVPFDEKALEDAVTKFRGSGQSSTAATPEAAAATSRDR